MNDRELLEYIAAQVGTLTKDVAEVKQYIAGMKGDITGVKNDIIRLENKVEKNLSALYDGYKQNTEAMKELKGCVEGSVRTDMKTV